jgi:hypothetical protein
LASGHTYQSLVAHLELESDRIRSTLDKDFCGARKGASMRVEMHVDQALWSDIHDELDRPHAFAAERVGFLTTNVYKPNAPDVLEIVALDWIPVIDADYIDDPRFGASIGASAFRKVLQHAYSKSVGLFHVHRHDHRGTPRFSSVDLTSMRKFIPDFFNAQPALPHGALVLSLTAAYGIVRLTSNSPDLSINRFLVVH